MAAVSLPAGVVTVIHDATTGQVGMFESVSVRVPTDAEDPVWVETTAAGLDETTGYPLYAGEAVAFDMVAGDTIYGYSENGGAVRVLRLNR